MKTCCQTAEVYATPGDVYRIAVHTGLDDFTEFRVPAKETYLDQDDDPAWRDRVFRADHSRRVLKRRATGDCMFLGEHGCVLPLDVRPLVCRLYPYDYTEAGITDELAPGCPLELLRTGQNLTEALGMTIGEARGWHRQLYEEIRLENALEIQEAAPR
jgi:Fe-S-cluster containining protein